MQLDQHTWIGRFVTRKVHTTHSGCDNLFSIIINSIILIGMLMIGSLVLFGFVMIGVHFYDPILAENIVGGPIFIEDDAFGPKLSLAGAHIAFGFGIAIATLACWFALWCVTVGPILVGTFYAWVWLREKFSQRKAKPNGLIVRCKENIEFGINVALGKLCPTIPITYKNIQIGTVLQVYGSYWVVEDISRAGNATKIHMRLTTELLSGAWNSYVLIATIAKGRVSFWCTHPNYPTECRIDTLKFKVDNFCNCVIAKGINNAD